MFATDYLKDHPGADDWVCVEDICCGYSTLLSHGYNCSAWWSPSRGIVAFGNDWFDVPDMPATSQPTDDEAHQWVLDHPGFLQRKINAALARNQAQKERWAELDRIFEKYGSGEVRAELREPDGSVRVIEHTCGIHGPLFMMQLAVQWMLKEAPPGTVLQKLDVYRRVPMNRGEKKMSQKKELNPSAQCEAPRAPGRKGRNASTQASNEKS